MKISVVTATYNCVETIQNCLDSVAKQSHRDIEHVVIDGLSNDGTLAILESRRMQLAVLLSESDYGIYCDTYLIRQLMINNKQKTRSPQKRCCDHDHDVWCSEHDQDRPPQISSKNGSLLASRDYACGLKTGGCYCHQRDPV